MSQHKHTLWPLSSSQHLPNSDKNQGNEGSAVKEHVSIQSQKEWFEGEKKRFWLTSVPNQSFNLELYTLSEMKLYPDSCQEQVQSHEESQNNVQQLLISDGLDGRQRTVVMHQQQLTSLSTKATSESWFAWSHEH